MSGKADRLRGRLTINPDEVAPAARPIRVQSVPDHRLPQAEAAEDNPASALRPVEPMGPPATGNRGRKLAQAAEPATEGAAYFRSFYVGNEVYDRFRAAIFWTSRNPQAAGAVPDNMSVAVEEFMATMAADLERRYNGGEAFPEPPKTRRRRRKADDR